MHETCHFVNPLDIQSRAFTLNLGTAQPIKCPSQGVVPARNWHVNVCG